MASGGRRSHWVLPALERRDLSIAAGLAAIAGYVDAVGFTKMFGVFPANQSGNAVLLGVALGDTTKAEAWRPALAIAAFAAGVIAGGLLGNRLRPVRRAAVLITIEAALLAVLAGAAGSLAHVTVPYGGAKEGLLLAVAAVAMGVQTDAIRRAGGVTVVTTYETGAIDRIADTVIGPRPDDAPPNVGRRLRVVLLAVVGSYVLGAAAGEAVADGWGGVLWGACAACAVLAAAVFLTEPT
jgi:uncharacterized membrane protein YoaK (UPF0700 family)